MHRWLTVEQDRILQQVSLHPLLNEIEDPNITVSMEISFDFFGFSYLSCPD
jgi:hypothetical protein